MYAAILNLNNGHCIVEYVKFLRKVLDFFSDNAFILTNNPLFRELVFSGSNFYLPKGSLSCLNDFQVLRLLTKKGHVKHYDENSYFSQRWLLLHKFTE